MTKKILTLALTVFGFALMAAGSAQANQCQGKPNGSFCSDVVGGNGVCSGGKCMAVSKPDDLIGASIEQLAFNAQADQLALDTGKPKCVGTCVIKLQEESTCNGRPFSSYSSVNCTRRIEE